MEINRTTTDSKRSDSHVSDPQAYVKPTEEENVSARSNGEGTMLFILVGLFVLATGGFVAFFISRRAKRRREYRGGSQDGFIPWTMSRNGLEMKPALMISHSLPDLSKSISQEQLLPQETNNKKPLRRTAQVARQTTLPTVPQRHASFRRQLSHQLHLNSVQFSVCSLQKKDKIGVLKPELYRSELSRDESVESSQGSDSETAGLLSFAVKYDTELQGLAVKVVQAQNLPIKDVTGSSDPYVKVYLLPDRLKKFCTKVHRRNLNPVFNENFFFSVKWDDLNERTLQFSVYDFDRFSRNDLIGHVFLRRLTDHVQSDVEIEYALDILTTKQDSKDLGELMLSLCYLPKAGRLTVTVIKLRNLRALDITGSSDPYVKVSLLCQGRRIKKKKTTVKKSTLNPVYNESLVFDVPNDNINDITLLLKVLDYDRVGSNELLGVNVIGRHAVGQGRDHWSEMLRSSRCPIAQWYSLQENVPVSLPVSPTKTLSRPLSSCLSST